jgi:hypothetical protein
MPLQFIDFTSHLTAEICSGFRIHSKVYAERYAGDSILFGHLKETLIRAGRTQKLRPPFVTTVSEREVVAIDIT